MGLSLITAIYQYAALAWSIAVCPTRQSRTSGRSGRRRDRRTIESLGAITLASRENLDNLTFVVNCNLQRLDGPVRGNGKIIQNWPLSAVLAGTSSRSHLK